MKKLLMSLVVVLSILFFQGPVFAASGKAVLPHYHGNYTSSSYYQVTHLFITNVTNATTSVTLTLYDASGTIVTDDDNYDAGKIRAESSVSATWDDNHSGSSATFDLDSNETVLVTITGSATAIIGYGRIEWEQPNSDAVYGLIAHGFKTRYSQNAGFYSQASIHINNGLPF